MSKVLLIETDGYCIETFSCFNFDDARRMMERRYNELYPENNDESSVEMSYINDNKAILYANGENVYVWTIVSPVYDLIRNEVITRGYSCNNEQIEKIINCVENNECVMECFDDAIHHCLSR